MASESQRVEITLTNHPLLLQGLAAAVEHFAEIAGLDAGGQRDLAEAAAQACQSTFRLLPAANGTLGVALENFPDRVEVTLEHCGEALPSAGLETFAGFGEGDEGGDLTGLELMSRVDRVLYHTEGGASQMTLVKYVSKIG